MIRMTDTHPVAQIAGRNVKVELTRANRSQEWLAQRLKRSQSGVSMRLNGRTPLNVIELAEIADMLRVPLAQLLDGIGAAPTAVTA